MDAGLLPDPRLERVCHSSCSALSGGTRTSEALVGRRNREPEVPAEKEHIVGVLGGRFVPQVAQDLDLGRDTRYFLAGDQATNKALGRVAKRASAWLWLHASAFPIEGHRVKVELRSVCITHDETHGEVILGDGEAQGSES